MLKFRLISIWLILLTALSIAAQPPIRLSVHEPALPDSIDIEYYSRKHFPQAALSVVGLNVGVWSFDRFVRNTDFSLISPKTMRENLRTGFKWDNDHLGTNMFMHPYHGNLYFNAARSNGFNFWQSSLFAIGGSLMWETVMENEYPSYNDLVATPIGGTALGEVAFRASDIVLDDRTGGMERFGREAAAFIISPMRGITRIINGDAWRRRSTSGRQFGIPNVALEMSAGVRVLSFKTKVADEGMGFDSQINLEYGDRFELRSSKPYDYFNVRLNLSIQASQPLLSQANICGRLIAGEIIDSPCSQLSAGLYQHFDFYDSDTLSVRTAKCPYKLGIPASIGSGLQYRFIDHGRFSVDAYTHANAVLLGGILSDYYNVDDRNYNLASGFSVKSGVNFVLNHDALSVSANYDYFRLFTWGGYRRGTDLRTANPRTLNVLGDQSAAFFGVGEFRLDAKLARHIYMTGIISHYMRSTRYRDFSPVRSSSFAYRLLLTYKF